jgi:hypothetical protein
VVSAPDSYNGDSGFKALKVEMKTNEYKRATILVQVNKTRLCWRIKKTTPKK